jgi:hypothetical protein
MITLALEREPAASGVRVTSNELIVELSDGRTLALPLAWYPRLSHAKPNERRYWRLLGNGYAIEWPDLDEHIGVDGLLAGRKSAESKKSLQRWLASRKTGKAP